MYTYQRVYITNIRYGYNLHISFLKLLLRFETHNCVWRSFRVILYAHRHACVKTFEIVFVYCLISFSLISSCLVCSFLSFIIFVCYLSHLSHVQGVLLILFSAINEIRRRESISTVFSINSIYVTQLKLACY